jgi:6-phosphogluconolactonase
MHVFQVDERCAPHGTAQRNLTQLEDALLGKTPLERDAVHAMPVEAAELETAADAYAATLRLQAGTPAVLDLVHLGLGDDGHTASLVPGDAVLDVDDRDVAATASYRGHRRMTLTLPLINRARARLWLVTGAGKADVLERLMTGDTGIPAGRVKAENAVVFADEAAVRGASA